MRLRTPAAILATAVLAVGLSSVTTASAAQTAPGDVVHSCVHKQTRYARIVNAGAKCRTTEVRVTWGGETQQGIATAGPQGERGPVGPQGPKGDPGIGTQGPQGERGRPGRDGKDGVGKPGEPGRDGADGQDGRDGLDSPYAGPHIIKHNGIPETCKPNGTYKGYPVIECKAGLPSSPLPTATPAPEPTPTATPTVAPTPTPTRPTPTRSTAR